MCELSHNLRIKPEFSFFFFSSQTQAIFLCSHFTRQLIMPTQKGIRYSTCVNRNGTELEQVVHTPNIVPERLTGRVQCTKSHSSVLHVYFLFSGFDSSFLLIRELKILRRRRRQKHRLKSDIAFFQSLSRLLQLIYHVKCKRTLFEPNS